MSIEDEFLKAILSGCMTVTNCQFIFGGHAQMGDFKQSPSASVEPQDRVVDSKLKSEKAKECWKRLVQNKYCHVEGSTYVWDATQVEYGYMVYIVSDILGCKHPSSGRLLWQDFLVLFPHNKSFDDAAKVAVSKNLSGLDSYKVWPNEAKNIRNILI